MLKTDFSSTSITDNGLYDMNAATMLLQRHGCGIHAVWASDTGSEGRESPVAAGDGGFRAGRVVTMGRDASLDGGVW